MCDLFVNFSEMMFTIDRLRVKKSKRVNLQKSKKPQAHRNHDKPRID